MRRDALIGCVSSYRFSLNVFQLICYAVQYRVFIYYFLGMKKPYFTTEVIKISKKHKYLSTTETCDILRGTQEKFTNVTQESPQQTEGTIISYYHYY